jgi:hypothetical protein
MLATRITVTGLAISGPGLGHTVGCVFCSVHGTCPYDEPFGFGLCFENHLDAYWCAAECEYSVADSQMTWIWKSLSIVEKNWTLDEVSFSNTPNIITLPISSVKELYWIILFQILVCDTRDHVTKPKTSHLKQFSAVYSVNRQPQNYPPLQGIIYLLSIIKNIPRIRYFHASPISTANSRKPFFTCLAYSHPLHHRPQHQATYKGPSSFPSLDH